ncbi:MAG TPA: hypothetical protein VE421_01885, partial [Burkholderiaceae bacterium]|nr:hypothetical protein [Burkholderiaceae bacterium]
MFSVHPIAIFLSLFAAFIVLALMQHRNRRARESFIDDYEFPPGVRQKVHERYPHLTEVQLDLVFDALREYFHLCRKAGKQLLSMPSQVVDVAWHEFILFTRNYLSFCRSALGGFLHHTPAEAWRPRPPRAKESSVRGDLRACAAGSIRRRPLRCRCCSQLTVASAFQTVSTMRLTAPY